MQLYVGDTGLPTNMVLRQDLVKAEEQLAELRTYRENIEKNLTLIDPRQPNPPLLEEFAREKLKLVEPDEVVILDP